MTDTVRRLTGRPARPIVDLMERHRALLMTPPPEHERTRPSKRTKTGGRPLGGPTGP